MQAALDSGLLVVGPLREQIRSRFRCNALPLHAEIAVRLFGEAIS